MKRWFAAIAAVCMLFLLACAKPLPEEDAPDPIQALMEAGRYQEALDQLDGREDEASRALREDCEAALYAAALAEAEEALSCGAYRKAQERFIALNEMERAAAAGELFAEETVLDAVESLKGLTSEADWDGGLTDIVLSLDECPESTEATLFSNALKKLAIGDMDETLLAIQALEEAGFSQLSMEDWGTVLESLLATKQGDADAMLAIAAAIKCLASGMTYTLGAIELDAKSLYETFGSESADGVAVVVTEHDYLLSADTAYLDLNRMQLLPEGAHATSLSDVRYVIQLKYSFIKIKKFTNFYNQGIREYCEIDLLELPQGRKLLPTKTVLAPSPASIKTAKITSEFVSGGAPNAAEVEQAYRAVVDKLQGLLDLARS